jgi:hypothetical protein
MTEVMDAGGTGAFDNSFVLDEENLALEESTQLFPVEDPYTHIDKPRFGSMAPSLRLGDLDKAYSKRKIKYARAVLDRLTFHPPYCYSPQQNRIALNQLAHPIQQLLATEQYGGKVPDELGKDIEAIYGHGAQQLGFLLDQEATTQDPSIRRNITGSLSELSIFLLAARGYRSDTSDRYLIVPSAEDEDYGKITPGDIHHGFDLKVIRRRDDVVIPLQVKTSAAHAKTYAENILVVSVADLIYDKKRSTQPAPLDLAHAMYFELQGARNFDEQLITRARDRLVTQFSLYESDPLGQ